MPKVNQSGNKQYESPQMVPDQLGTKNYGGAAPTSRDIAKSANARSTKRHDMKGEQFADVGVLADSAHMAGNEMVGIRDDGYLVKKNIETGSQVMLHSLPPGMDIEDQENCDIRQMPFKTITAMGYPGDGWSKEADKGRPATTNYNYGGKS